jgi:hypothetical protein
VTGKEFNKLRKRIRSIALPWLECLGLKWWTVNLDYSRDGKDVNPPREENGATWDCAACASAQWQYMTATVTFNMPVLMDFSDEKLESTIIHELMHILVREMREWSPEDVSQERIAVGRNAEERVVTTLTKAFLWTRAMARREAKEMAAKKTAPKMSMKAALKKVETTQADARHDKRLGEGTPADKRADAAIAKKIMAGKRVK